MLDKIFPVLCLLFLSQLGLAQDFQQDFENYMSVGDTNQQRIILNDWEKHNPKDPEYFVSYFNFCFNNAKRVSLQLNQNDADNGEGLTITDSSGNEVGFIGEGITYDMPLLQEGLDKIQAGILLYPDRLDMRFGKIFALGEARLWDAFTQEIVSSIQYSAKNKNKWLWKKNQEVADPQKVFLGALQDYQVTLYDTQNDSLLKNMRRIAEEVLKFYPGHMESLTNLAISYILEKQYAKAIPYLERAEKDNPNNGVVLSNMAYVLELMNDYSKSILYYEKILKLPDADAQQFAAGRIEALKMKQKK